MFVFSFTEYCLYIFEHKFEMIRRQMDAAVNNPRSMPPHSIVTRNGERIYFSNVYRLSGFNKTLYCVFTGYYEIIPIWDDPVTLNKHQTDEAPSNIYVTDIYASDKYTSDNSAAFDCLSSTDSQIVIAMSIFFKSPNFFCYYFVLRYIFRLIFPFFFPFVFSNLLYFYFLFLFIITSVNLILS